MKELENIAALLKRAGAKTPIQCDGTIESAVATGLSIALCIVEQQIERAKPVIDWRVEAAKVIEGDFVRAIKICRELTGASLASAKDACEELRGRVLSGEWKIGGVA